MHASDSQIGWEASDPVTRDVTRDALGDRQPAPRSAGARRMARLRARRQAAGLVEVRGLVAEELAAEIQAAGGLAAWIEAHAVPKPANAAHNRRLWAGRALESLRVLRRVLGVSTRRRRYE